LIVLYIFSIVGFVLKNFLMLLILYQIFVVVFGVIFGERKNTKNEGTLFIVMEGICTALWHPTTVSMNKIVVQLVWEWQKFWKLACRSMYTNYSSWPIAEGRALLWTLTQLTSFASALIYLKWISWPTMQQRNQISLVNFVTYILMGSTVVQYLGTWIRKQIKGKLISFCRPQARLSPKGWLRQK
jgi:hypothetical protein